MTRPRRKHLLSLAALAALCACGGIEATSHPGPSTTLASRPTPPANPAGQPSPYVQACGAGCAGLEVMGPVTELLMPEKDSIEQAAITFAGGHWYAAWGGRGADMTLVQRFTADGRSDGEALHLDGVLTPGSLLASSHGGGQVTLLGYAGGAYTADGFTQSLHRMDLDLKAVGTPLLLRSPTTLQLAVSVEMNEAGDLLWTTVLDRPGTLVRETRVAVDAVPGQAVTVRDWWLGVEREGAFERIDGKRYFIDATQGALRIRELLDGGALGKPRIAFEIPAEEGRQLLLSKRVGNQWYVGAFAVTLGSVVRIQALDASSLAAVGSRIELSWPNDRPYSLVDANGTPMLLGCLHPQGKASKASLVPLDANAGAACRANTVSLPSLPDHYQTIRALHFNGDVAGVALAAWDSTGVSRLFFTRLRCVRGAPAASRS